jgi:hypothetical protein
MKPQDIETLCLCNNDEVFQANLQKSDIFDQGLARPKLLKNERGASIAYARVYAETSADYLFCAHQDVYLPKDFKTHLLKSLDMLARIDANWAVLGCYGVKSDGTHAGQVWDSGLDRVIGEAPAGAVEVASVDELFFIVRTGIPGLFDADLPDFHLYGTDIVQNARTRGFKSYVTHLPIIHNSRRVTNLGGGYTKSYHYMQKKWTNALPLQNTIIPVTRTGLPLYVKRLKMGMQFGFSQTRQPNPTRDPQAIAKQLNWE